MPSLSDISLVPAIRETHGTLVFDCGDADLNEFFTTDCYEYQAQCLSQTRIAFYQEHAVGYITLLSDSIILQTSEKKRLFDFHGRVYHFPSLKIGRLAIHRDYQKSGIGRGTAAIRGRRGGATQQ